MATTYNELRDAVLTFLANCTVESDLDGEYHSDGTVTDHSKWIITAKTFEMSELAYALGIEQRLMENPWMAIERCMKEENEADEIMVAHDIERLDKQARAADHDS